MRAISKLSARPTRKAVVLGFGFSDPRGTRPRLGPSPRRLAEEFFRADNALFANNWHRSTQASPKRASLDHQKVNFIRLNGKIGVKLSP
jgi:hypothetical protein